MSPRAPRISNRNAEYETRISGRYDYPLTPAHLVIDIHFYSTSISPEVLEGQSVSLGTPANTMQFLDGLYVSEKGNIVED